MDTATITAVAAAVVAIVSGALTYRASAQANRISAVKVDAEAYDRAQKIYQGGLEESERQVAALRAQIERLEIQMSREREISERYRQQIRGLKNTVTRMERHIAIMRAKLQELGISVPELSTDSDDEESDRSATG